MDVPRKLDEPMKRLVALGKTFAYADNVEAKKATLDNVLDEVRGDGSGAIWSRTPRRPITW
jgi:hypothetical protein